MKKEIGELTKGRCIYRGAKMKEQYWHDVETEGVPKETGNYIGIDYEHEN